MIELLVDVNVSFNDYDKMHHRQKESIKRKMKGVIRSLLSEHRKKRFKRYQLEIRYNTRLDVDNVFMLPKFLNDCLKECKHTRDDNNSIFYSMSITYDQTIKKGLYRVVVKP